MALTNFDTLPEHARLWAFTSGDALDENQRTQVLEGVEAFLNGWAAHGAPLTAGFTLLHDRFLLVGVDQDETAPSGCSIDAMTRFLREMREKTGIDFIDSPTCCYRDGDDVRCVTRSGFRELASADNVDGDTMVFDLTVPTVGDYKSGRFETAAATSWYAKAFPIGETTT